MKLKQILYELGMLDKYAFADNPDISSNFYGGKSEPNNDFENELYAAIESWVNDLEDAHLYYLMKKYRNKLIKKYPDIFKPATHNGTILYRGINRVSDDILSNIKDTSMDDWEKSDLIDGGYKYKKPIKYKPHKLVQSWTSYLDVAKDFSMRTVLQTTQNSEFFMNSDVLQYIYDGNSESECIHFDKSYSEPIFLHVNQGLVKFHKIASNTTTEKMLDLLNIDYYTINKDGSVDVDGDVNLTDRGLTKIPVKFGKVTGRFYCRGNNLTSLENSPKSVDGTYDCSYNPKLTSLKGIENMVVDGDFWCKNNPKLKSLDYLPKHIGGKVYSDFE